MRKSSIIINIENPCTQDWKSMSNNEQGKFCHNCAKNVIDFTRYSDEELAKRFANSSEQLCGRFEKKQLNRVVSSKQDSKLFSPGKYLAGLLLLTTSKNSLAQANIQPSTLTYVSQHQTLSETVKSPFPTDSLSKIIEGVVIDSVSGEVYPSAKVQIVELHLFAVTDIDGKFKVVIPNSVDLRFLTILVETYDSEPETILVDRAKNTSNLEIQLKTDLEIVEIGLFYTEKPKKWWQFWKRR